MRAFHLGPPFPVRSRSFFLFPQPPQRVTQVLQVLPDVSETLGEPLSVNSVRNLSKISGKTAQGVLGWFG
jgi:hypothetical protein